MRILKLKNRKMKRRLDHANSIRTTKRAWRDSPTIENMKFEDFRAIVILQRLAELFSFSTEELAALKILCYSDRNSAPRQLEQFKRYLSDMEKRTNQTIPKEQLNEYFGGRYRKDVVISGRVYKDRLGPNNIGEKMRKKS